MIMRTLVGIESMIDKFSSDDYGRYTKMAMRLEPDCAEMVLGNGDTKYEPLMTTNHCSYICLYNRHGMFNISK